MNVNSRIPNFKGMLVIKKEDDQGEDKFAINTDDIATINNVRHCNYKESTVITRRVEPSYDRGGYMYSTIKQEINVPIGQVLDAYKRAVSCGVGTIKENKN